MNGFALNNIQNCYVGSTPATAIYLGSNKIWPTTQHDYSQDYLTFEVIEDTKFLYRSSYSTNKLLYSLDNGSSWTLLEQQTWTPTITAGNKILWKQTDLKNELSHGICSFSNNSTIDSSTGDSIPVGKFNISGNIMSLLYGDDFINKTSLSRPDIGMDGQCVFMNLFQNCKGLINANNLILPATTLAGYCYAGMFEGCTSLTTAPELPATSIAIHCYAGMFSGCPSLTKAPELPATTALTDCYRYMFKDCTSLTTAPVLPATKLYGDCYYGMFQGCSSLTTAPELPATTLISYCYSYMFKDCTSLTTAPVLPATTLTDYCYRYMFNGCTNLNYIKMLATDISATSPLGYWVYGVSSTGTFVKNAAMTTLSTGTSGIPAGWNIQNA